MTDFYGLRYIVLDLRSECHDIAYGVLTSASVATLKTSAGSLFLVHCSLFPKKCRFRLSFRKGRLSVDYPYQKEPIFDHICWSYFRV